MAMAMASSCSSSFMSFHVNCSVQRRSISPELPPFKSSLLSLFKPWLKDLQSQRASLRVEISSPIKDTYMKILDAFVDSVFEFVDQPLLPSQKNFAPVDELGQAISIDTIEGKIPNDFPDGVYIRNGPNPLFGGLKSTRSMFGRSSHTWIEGEGMLHAVYFYRDGDGRWNVHYNNRYLETETFKLEKQRNRPSFLPAIEGDSLAILSAFLLNFLRFGKTDKYISNTNVFEHSGKYYSVAENHIPQEIDILTLETLSTWDINGAWNRPFTSHPKRAPGTGELVIIGVNAIEPFMELGVISADGKDLVHKVDLKLNRCSLCHEIGVTERYNVIMDLPLTIDVNRLLQGGPLIRFDKGEYARIGVMPRYGSANDICWFDVEPCSIFHIFNCFEEENDQVVVRGCRALESIIPGPDFGINKFDWFSKRLKPLKSVDRENMASVTLDTSCHSCPNTSATTIETGDGSMFYRTYEWILNMKTGEVKERNLTSLNFSMDFPMINADFTGIRNKFGYAQVVDSSASSASGMVKYGGLAKLHFEESKAGFSQKDSQHEDAIEVEYHKFDANIFCTGAAFVPRENWREEDDGWLITFVHNEQTNISQVYIIDAKNISNEPIAKITLLVRVPYGFHGTYICP